MQTIHFIMRASLPQTLLAIALLAAGCSEKPNKQLAELQADAPAAGSSTATSRNKQLAELEADAQSAKAAQTAMVFEVTKRYLYGQLSTQVTAVTDESISWVKALRIPFDEMGTVQYYQQGESYMRKHEQYARDRITGMTKEIFFAPMMITFESRTPHTKEIWGFIDDFRKLEDEEITNFWNPLVEAYSKNHLGTVYSMLKAFEGGEFPRKRRDLLRQVDAAIARDKPEK